MKNKKRDCFSASWRIAMTRMRAGFNLIEVLVAVAIIMLLTGGILVYFNDFNSRQKIEGARIELIGSLKLARNYAVTRQKAKGGSEIQYVFVTIDDEENQAKIWVEDQDGISYFEKFLNDGKPTISTTSESFCFDAYNGRVKKYETGTGCLSENIDNPIEIILSSEAVSNTKTVIIDSSGLIYEGN